VHRAGLVRRKRSIPTFPAGARGSAAGAGNQTLHAERPAQLDPGNQTASKSRMRLRASSCSICSYNLCSVCWPAVRATAHAGPASSCRWAVAGVLVGCSSFFFCEKDIFHYLKAQYRYGAKHTPIKVLECSLHSTLSIMYICFAREKARTRNCCLSCLLCEPVSHLVCVSVDLDDRMLHAFSDFCELSNNWSQ